MKRIGNLFGRITDIDNIVRAHTNARKGKTRYGDVQKVDKDVIGWCTKIQKMLVDKTYTTSKYHIFKIKDRGKEREVCDLPYYPDRIIQWALLQIIEEIFCKHFIHQTYAAIPRKGTHATLTQARAYMEDIKGTEFCLKIDVKKFFPNIDKDILKALLRRKIKCKDTLWLLDDIIDSYENGIPIGNFTSQYFGNYYLSYFDHWMKEVKHIKYYMRYMDDIVVMHHSKEFLHQLRRDMAVYLEEHLKLKIKENWQVFPTRVRGLDFVGYRCFENYTLVRKATKIRLKRVTRKLLRKLNDGFDLSQSDESSIGSYNGILCWADCYRLKQTTLNKILEVKNASTWNTNCATT